MPTTVVPSPSSLDPAKQPGSIAEQEALRFVCSTCISFREAKGERRMFQRGRFQAVHPLETGILRAQPQILRGPSHTQNTQ